MKLRLLILCSLLWCATKAQSQEQSSRGEDRRARMTPETLWKVKRVSGLGLTKDGRSLVYKVATPNVAANKMESKYYTIGLDGKSATELTSLGDLLPQKALSPDGKMKIVEQQVLVDQINATDIYNDLPKANAQVYTALDYRHWDTWNDGHYNHLFVGASQAEEATYIDIMKGEAYDCPTKPFGGDEDYTWSNDGKYIVYVSKKLKGTAAAQSTNTDIYAYDVSTGMTKNWTENNKGYDTHPIFNAQGDMAYLSMDVDGYESDKNDLVVRHPSGMHINLTHAWDGTVNSFLWSNDGRKLYFNAPVGGTIQLFEVDYIGLSKKRPQVKQLTEGQWDVNGLIAVKDNALIVSRCSMVEASELYTYQVNDKKWTKLTQENDNLYQSIARSKAEKRMVKTTDGKEMLVWVVYPPAFNPAKKYPTLLYCQGGPQSALSQFYSFRWNLDLIASAGYIVVAPNRRGMPGHGVEWNEQISKDWGGQNIQDYLSAIDDVAKEKYVDKDRLGAIGASYGGYSVFYLAGIHQNRFKTFIAHDGIFNTTSMYGTTEEMFFVNYDLGGPYWDPAFKKSYQEFNPINHVDKWNTPIYIIQGGKDYRVPIGQGQEAFNAAQLKGIKSKFLYLPDENHWVIQPQNSLVWQREFFKWLKETL